MIHNSALETAGKPKRDFFGTLSGDGIVLEHKALCMEVLSMKYFSSRIFAVLLLGLILPFGFRYLNAQSNAGEGSSQPQSKNKAGAAEFDSGGLMRLMRIKTDLSPGTNGSAFSPITTKMATIAFPKRRLSPFPSRAAPRARPIRTRGVWRPFAGWMWTGTIRLIPRSGPAMLRILPIWMQTRTAP